MEERLEAIKILEKVNNESGYSGELLNSIKRTDLNKAFVRELVYGVIENKILLDSILNNFLEDTNRKLPDKIQEIFRISILQLLFLDSIPEYAVISEALNLADNINLGGYKGVLNAILRKIINFNISNYLNSIKDSKLRLRTEFSVSPFFFNSLYTEYSKKTMIKIFKSYIEKQEFIIRINNIKSNIDEVKKILNDNNIVFSKHPFLNNSLIIENPNNIFKLKAFKNGFFTIQDGGSSLVAKILNPKEESLLLDICAAPGGKTCYLSEIMNNTGKILANDKYPQKLKKIEENISRLGCTNISTVSFDGTKIKEEYIEKFDYILVDAPCSGSGIVSRKPEIKLYRTEEQLNDLVSLQRDIFINAFKYLKKGGEIIYSTCSTFKRENEDQLKWFCHNIKDIKILPIDFKNKKLEYIKLMPYEIGCDGFFICKFTKI